MTKLSGASKNEIQQHYDASDAFYRLWLDETLTYSCGLWLDDYTANLADAQTNKLRYHIDNLALSRDAVLLDIGCGWGGLLRFARQHYALQSGIGLTLSEAQLQSIQRTDPDTTVHLQDWNNHQPSQSYDGIVSIGAFEHFARPEHSPKEKVKIYQHFFRRCHEWLKPNARLSLQTIAYHDMSSGDASTFMQSKIFQGSELPFRKEITVASDQCFRLLSVRDDNLDYERTCVMWLRNLQKNRAQAITLVGKDTVRNYECYLRLSAIGFNTKKITLLRMLFEKFND